MLLGVKIRHFSLTLHVGLTTVVLPVNNVVAVLCTWPSLNAHASCEVLCIMAYGLFQILI